MQMSDSETSALTVLQIFRSLVISGSWFVSQWKPMINVVVDI